MKDEYISTEHFLLALAAGKTGAGEALRKAGATKDAILAALVEVRGNQRVTDQDPEAKYEALDRYTRDLTKLAAQRKLDPVIARGELRCIGATTLDEYRKHIEKDKALERRFQPVMIEEPSVEDTIAILRGLKDKYEVHHGIRIRDAALVAAARLSHRYIPARQLPDKAIDLADEAASRHKMEIESVHTPIDTLERRVMVLEVERAALEREKGDRRAKQRLPEVEREIAELKEQASAMKAQWQAERDVIKSLRGKKEKLEELKAEADRLQRHGDYARASELRFG